MHYFIKKILNKYIDYKSSKTDRQLFVIESDDWGSTRTKSIKIRDKLNSISELVANDNYIQHDNIADENDLSELFDTLGSVKDSVGNPACLTPNVCTANPDYDEIRKHDYHQFFYKPFTDTLKEFSSSEDLFKIWNDGIRNNLFKPQLHGREHLHALAWLAELRAGNKQLLSAFEYEAFGIPYYPLLNQKRKNFQAALDIYEIDGEKQFKQKWIKEGADIFEKSFGYRAKSFIAPTYTWHSNVHKELKRSKIESLQGIKLQNEPTYGVKNKYSKKLHYTGKVDKKSGLIFTVRNTFFEPAITPRQDHVSYTLKQIDNAFGKKMPVILGSHRINFIGNLNEKNRRKNLAMLKEILKIVTIKYPKIEFISSDQLLDFI